MRFNNRFCNLMDIPDLPMGAFEHIGDRKIKPQGGGNPISAVTDPISKAIGTDGGGGGALGALADIDPGKAIGKVLSEVDKFVGREIPGGWKTVGLVAASVAAPYALSAMGTAGAGAAGAAGAADAAFVAADAASLAASGLSEAAIAQNLAMAGVESFAAADAAALAASGLSEAAIAQNLSYAYGAGELMPAAAQVAGGAAPVYDYSQQAMVTPEGNVIPATTPGSEVAAMDAQIKAAGEEALKKYGGGMTVGKGLQLAQLGKGLLGSPVQQQPNPYQQQVARKQAPSGQVDYSGLLSLLQPRSSQRKTSLLG